MSTNARRCFWLGLCPVLLIAAGCKTGPNLGPIYKLHMPEQPRAAAAVAVSITDKRPDNERKYHQGAIEPARYQDGIETLTLDNFEPQITDLLKQMFTQRLSTLAVPPVWADVEIRRFRTLIDRREILAAEYERQLLDDATDSAVGIGVGMGQGGAGNIAGGVAAGILTAAKTQQKLRAVDADRTSWDHAMFGITCEIQLHVELHWEGNQMAAFDVDAKSHSMPQDNIQFADLVNSSKWDISPTVEQGVLQVSDKLLTIASAKLPAGLARQVRASPQPTTEELPPTEAHEFEPDVAPQESLPPPANQREAESRTAGAVKL